MRNEFRKLVPDTVENLLIALVSDCTLASSDDWKTTAAVDAERERLAQMIGDYQWR